MFHVLADPAIYRYIDDETPACVDALRRRYTVLEARRSPDGTEQWLNWAVRDAAGSLAGYVQATIRTPGAAWVAYLFASRHWGKGLAQQAVRQMIRILAADHAVVQLLAAVNEHNEPSLRLLERLGFTVLPLAQQVLRGVSPGDVLLSCEIAKLRSQANTARSNRSP
jgi:aminoglycoside 6'-N-acetyltransferase